jgi:hypothetical protein
MVAELFVNGSVIGQSMLLAYCLNWQIHRATALCQPPKNEQLTATQPIAAGCAT